jgi:catechol 2,3-dioxygenase-like lactoylglutathione lyase family enzyme
MIHHIALFARRPNELAAFYSSVLGLSEIRRTEDNQGLYSVWLEAGSVIFMIERADDTDSPSAREGLRPANHCLIAFAMDAAQQKAFTDRLTSHGGDVLRRTEFTLYFEDPEKNRLAVSWYPG